jgi:hypothetical protein
MKMYFAILLFLINISVSGSIFYVSLKGNDRNSGSKSSPWATWQKGFSSIKAGDTLFIRGGVYLSKEVAADGYFQGVFAGNKNGTPEKKFSVIAYPGEVPVLDLGNLAGSDRRFGINLANCSYWYLKGLTVTNLHAFNADLCAGFRNNSSNNITLELCVSHDNDGTGFAQSEGGNGNYYFRCDSYNNYDHLNGGESGDGFIFGKNTDQTVKVVCNECRSWHNSDDGFDSFGNEGTVEWHSCWSFNNGYGIDGDGGGFKLGATYLKPLGSPQRILTNCIAFNNKGIAFDLTEGEIGVSIFNCIAYKNFGGFFIGPKGLSSSVLKNNISYGNLHSFNFEVKFVQDHNSWNDKSEIKDSDFKSVSPITINGPRKKDGSLPDTDFLHPSDGSALIDTGINVGLAFKGNAPDIGPFESDYSNDKASSSNKASWLRKFFFRIRK